MRNKGYFVGAVPLYIHSTPVQAHAHARIVKKIDFCKEKKCIYPLDKIFFCPTFATAKWGKPCTPYRKAQNYTTMKNNTNNNAKGVTAKIVAVATKQANEEFKTLSACIKALARLDNKPAELANCCKVLGIRANCKGNEWQELCERIRQNTPYYIEVDGKRVPAERIRKAKRTTTEVVTEVREVSSWTFRKILACARVYSESIERKDLCK